MVAVKGTTVKNDFKNICDREEYAELERLKKNAEYLTMIDRAMELD